MTLERIAIYKVKPIPKHGNMQSWSICNRQSSVKLLKSMQGSKYILISAGNFIWKQNKKKWENSWGNIFIDFIKQWLSKNGTFHNRY